MSKFIKLTSDVGTEFILNASRITQIVKTALNTDGQNDCKIFWEEAENESGSIRLREDAVREKFSEIAKILCENK